MALDFSLSEEQKLIQQSARELVKKFAGRRNEFREMILKQRKFPQEIWDAVAEAGFLGALVPETYGGSGMGLLALTFAIEEMAANGFGNALIILTAMDALCLLRNGPEALRRKFLPGMADGTHKFCFAVTEANAGSDTFRISTHAKKKDGVYFINGSKTFISGADVADYMLLVTRTKTLAEVEAEGLPKAFGLSLFIVDTKSKGIELQLLNTRGIEGVNQYTVFFEDVEVPAEHLVGEENAGTMVLFKALNPERILAAATALGISELCLKTACNYAHERKVFKNTPIGAYQGIAHPLAETKILQEAVRLCAYRAAWAFDQELDPLTAGLYTNVAKYLAAELGIKAVDTAIETLGGNGFSEDFGIAHLWEGMRLMKTAPISKEMILNYVAEHTLGLPRSY